MLDGSGDGGGRCRCGPRGAAAPGVELHDGLLAQVAVRVGAPALDLSTHQRVEERHHARVLLDGLADVVVGQTTAAVEHQADVLLVGVEAAGLVLNAALQVTKTLWLLVGTPHLLRREKQCRGMVEGDVDGEKTKTKDLKLDRRQNDRMKYGRRKSVVSGQCDRFSVIDSLFLQNTWTCITFHSVQ